MKLKSVPRKLRGSGYFRTTNSSTIISGGTFTFTLDDRFKPYDDVVVVNLNSDNDCNLELNWGIKQPLPKGNSINIDTPTENLKVENNGSGTISVDEIEVYYRALPQQRKLIDEGFKITGIFQALRGLLR